MHIEDINSNANLYDNEGYEKVERWNIEKTNKLAENYKNILDLIGEDVNREGLQDTPIRVAKAIQFLTQGYNLDPKEILNSAKFKEDYRQMVIVKDIELYSMCEHHMIPCSLYSQRTNYRIKQNCSRC